MAARNTDTPDDNYSFFTGAAFSSTTDFPKETTGDFLSFSFYPDVLVYDKFSYIYMPQLLDKYKLDYIADYSHDYFDKNHKVLVIPSGEWMGEEHSEITREAIKQFVEGGGTLLVLSQQYDEHIVGLVPVPQGETLTSYGWRQDQSCYSGSVYFNGMHPVLSSATNQLLSAAVDGYFESWPQNSTVLLNRTKNREAAMLYYPYGEGHVILTSFYTDWGASHSQATIHELRVFRDLISFARDPKLPVPMYNLGQGYTPSIQLNVDVKNLCEVSASSVKLLAYTPDRDRLLYETVRSVTLAPGAGTTLDVQFTLPVLIDSQFGICNVYYELYDAEGKLVQMRTFTPSGRFAVYHLKQSYTPTDGVDMWLTVDKEEVFLDETPQFTLHIKNHSDTDKSIDFQYECDHRGRKPLFSLTVPAGETVQRIIFLEDEDPFTRLWIFPSQGKTISKGLQLIRQRTNSTITLTSPSKLAPGLPVNYKISTSHVSPYPAPGAYTLRVSLEKRDPLTGYQHVKDIYETTHDYSASGPLSYEGVYIQDLASGAMLTGGYYRFKLEVFTPDNFLDVTHYAELNLGSSGYHGGIKSLQKDGSDVSYLSAGTQYTIPLEIKNITTTNDYETRDGKYRVSIVSEDGQEIYTKTVSGISLAHGGQDVLNETFTFNPPALGNYYLKAIFWDETRDEPQFLVNFQRLVYKTSMSIQTQKSGGEYYRYGESADVTVYVGGLGAYNLRFISEEAGIDEVHALTVPAGQAGASLSFQVPIGLKPYYNVRVQAEDAAGIITHAAQRLPVENIRLYHRGKFKESVARAGSPLEFESVISPLAGLSAPLAGEIIITSPGLEIDLRQAVTLQPGQPTTLSFSFPLAASLTSGLYPLDVTFSAAGIPFIEERYLTYIPEARLNVALPFQPTGPFNAGDTLTIPLENTGGLSGTFDLDLYLRDPFGNKVVQIQEQHTFTAGETRSLTMTLPATTVSGPYMLVRSAVETSTNWRGGQSDAFTVTGLSATLDSSTNKDKYFSTENVTGRSTITPGASDISGGVLETEIIRLREGRAAEKLGDYVLSITRDYRDRLWVGSETGIHMLNNAGWRDYTQMPNGDPIEWVDYIAAGFNDVVYAFTDGGIVKIADQALSTIPPYMPGFDLTRPAVDTSSRLWAVSHAEVVEVIYYQDLSWHSFSYDYTDQILANPTGGVWLIHSSRIIKVSDSLVKQTWDTGSGLPETGINSACADSTGTLWFTTQSGSLYSLKSGVFSSYGHFGNAPVNGINTVTADETGQVFVIGTDASYKNMLYAVDRSNEKYISQGIQWSFSDSYNDFPQLTAIGGYVYANGSYGSGGEGEGGTIVRGLLKLGDGSGLLKDIPWNHSYTISASAGTPLNVTLDSGINLPAGSYMLNTRLLSPLGQYLAASQYPFSVRETGLSVAMLHTRPLSSQVTKKDEDVLMSVELFNNTSDPQENLDLKITQTSPSGITGEIHSQTITLTPGQTFNHEFTFTPPNTGTWKLEATLGGNDGGGTGEEGGGEGGVVAGDLSQPTETTSTAAILARAEMLIPVEEPSLSMEILAPDFTGDDPATVTLDLINNGSLPLALQLEVNETGVSTPLINQSVSLEPLSRTAVTFSAQPGKDHTYAINVSGDFTLSRTFTLAHGYKENLSLTVLPSYREGPVSVPFTLEHPGGLSFPGELSVDLYSAGSSAPLYSAQKPYTLYPQPGAAVSGSFDFQLLPGAYELKYHTLHSPQVQTASFAVQPSGRGTVAMTGPTSLPTGDNDIPYSVTNTDTAAGTIPVTLTVTNDQTSTVLLTSTKEFYLLPGETGAGILSVHFDQPGNYTLTATGAKLNSPLTSAIKVMPDKEISASLSVGQPQSGAIPISLNITNDGLLEFTGVLAVQSGGVIQETPVTVSSGSSIDEAVPFPFSLLPAGDIDINASLLDSQGNLLTETSGTVTIKPASIQLINIPQDLEIAAGGFSEVPLTLKNTGHLPGTVILKVDAFDTLDRRLEVTVAGDEEIQLSGLFIDVPGDLPTGNYPFYYSLTPESGGLPATGHFTFKVNGVALDVDASLDQSIYNTGETARLTISIASSSSQAQNLPLDVLVNWGAFNQRRSITLSGTTSLDFDIPLDEERTEKIFYGIYHQDGKGIYLNDIYLNFKGDISVELDRQVYAPGDIIHAVFTSASPGVLTASAFGESHTLSISATASASFQVPADTLGGTHTIGWEFSPADASLPGISGFKAFDVSGLVVKVAKAGLMAGKYAPGDTITAQFLFESNRNDSLDLRTWVTAPSGDWQYLGEIPAAVSAQKQVNVTSSGSFTTTEAGTHEYIYGLYKEDQLVVSGRLAFDVGDAVLMGLATQYFEYKQGSETVIVNVDHFGTGSAKLELFLDEEKVQERTISLNGVSRTQLSLNPGQISGGSHYLRAVITKDGLTSTKSTSFIYGTHLPDLTISMVSTENQGLDYTYALSVGNSGQTAAPSTSLTFSDNDATVTTLSVPALQPGDSHHTVVTWSGNGKAGSHEFVFTTDSASAVKEFNESNNTLTFTEEIPLLFYNLEVDPTTWPANTPITILTRLINNQSAPAVLTLDMNITNDDTGQTVFQRSQPETLSAFASKTVSDTFDTGVYPAGSYTLSQNISGDGVDLFKDISVYIQATKALSASLTLQPITISANTPADLELSMNLENTGNVPLENETLFIEVFNIQGQEIVNSEEFLFNLPIAGQSNEIKVLSLILDEGQYEVRLRYQETQVAMAPLTVIGGIEKEKTLDIRPRVLIMNLHQTGGGNTGSVAGLQFIFQLLTAYQVNYDTGMGQPDAMVKLHKGYSNITWMLGNLTGQKELDELSQRVWSGDGLIVVRDKADSSQGWSQFLGVKVKQTSAKKREAQFDLLPSNSPLHPHYQLSGQVTLNKAQDLQLEVTATDVHVVAQTPANQYPIITYRPYGHGHILVLSVPLDFSGGTGEISQLFLNAVNLFSKDVYGGTGSDISRLLPIRLNLTNQTVSSHDVNLEEVLPYGVESYDFDPAPLDDTSGDDKLKWTITVPGSSETPMTYWLRLPDQIGGYEILSRFYTGDWTTVEEEIPLTFEVTQTLTGRIDELLTSLDTLEVNASDSKNLGKAKDYLQKIRSRGIESDMLSHLEKNVEDAAQASLYLGLIQSADVKAQRLAVTYLMRMLARKHYQIAVPQTQ